MARCRGRQVMQLFLAVCEANEEFAKCLMSDGRKAQVVVVVKFQRGPSQKVSAGALVESMDNNLT
jgi:hypothetical protein